VLVGRSAFVSGVVKFVYGPLAQLVTVCDKDNNVLSTFVRLLIYFPTRNGHGQGSCFLRVS